MSEKQKSVESLTPWERNPRRLSASRSRILSKTITKFGDLSGITYNIALKKLATGHQRKTQLNQKAKIVITTRFDPPTSTGTTAEGYVEDMGEQWKYREVNWPDEQHHAAAALAANEAGGEWDRDLLKDVLFDLDSFNIDMEDTGFELTKIENILGGNSFNFDASFGLSKESEMVDIAKLQPHPLNFRKYPDDYLAHAIHALKENGDYKFITVANDFTILSGHGVYYAAMKEGIKTFTIKKLEFDRNDTRSLKILINDNDIAHLAEIDDRMLTELLKNIKDNDPNGLAGTGYDEKMLANLLMVTRPESEIKDINEAQHWVGMPEFETTAQAYKLMVSFETEFLRTEFMKKINATVVNHKEGKTISIWWPEKQIQDISSLKFADTNE